MKHLLLCDTSIGSDNVGDEIIMDYCRSHILSMFGDDTYFIDRIPTHLEIGQTTYLINDKSEYSFVCGTNILKTSMLKKKSWKIGLRDAFRLKDLCLMGVGWGSYNSFKTDFYTKFIYKSILSKKLLHAVRDNYTKLRLAELGIKNVIVTACPTMWNLSPEHCKSIPKKKSENVITALTHYTADKEYDVKMLHLLSQNYGKIYLWLQQAEDLDYFYSLNSGVNVHLIKPLLNDYDSLLSSEDVDFVGSRLHGGIRALNHKRRTLILAVDNRAAEIHKDTNLPVVDRKDIASIEAWINGSMSTEITLPIDNISEWKNQFCVDAK